jgi:hypothetical protein
MTNGAWNLEVHDPLVGRGSLISQHLGLSGAQAASLMELHADKALLLRERGKPTADDHEALRSFQLRTGNGWSPTGSRSCGRRYFPHRPAARMHSNTFIARASSGRPHRDCRTLETAIKTGQNTP